jgi:hypothetical protein
MFGLILGCLCGCIVAIVFCAVSQLFLLDLSETLILKFLGVATLLGGVPLALVPHYGPKYALFGGMIGYWVGFVALLVRRKMGQTTN